MPQVSVIIPSYNCECYIAQTIESVLNQTFKDLELIVIDDGSTDRTREIVSSYGPLVQLITQANAGVCVARNRGIREAAGDFICLIDHDDYWFPEKLAKQLSAFQSHPEAGVVCSTYIRWHAAQDGQFPRPDSFDITAYPDEFEPDFSGWIYHQFLLDCWMLTSSAMFRAEVFNYCGAFDETLPYSEDWDLWLRISREYPTIQLNRSMTLYRQHTQQGNRVVRDVDYRTQLLIKALKKWGLCSRDGRCVNRRQFFTQLAAYHASFAFGQLKAGNRKRAISSFLKGWMAAPVNLKYLAFIGAALLGWRPKW